MNNMTQNPVDTLEVLLRDARESASSHSIPADDGAENDDAREAEGSVADEHDVDQASTAFVNKCVW
jgi:hypothetical protein